MRCEINAWRDRWGGLGPDRWVAWVLSRVGGGGGGGSGLQCRAVIGIWSNSQRPKGFMPSSIRYTLSTPRNRGEDLRCKSTASSELEMRL